MKTSFAMRVLMAATALITIGMYNSAQCQHASNHFIGATYSYSISSEMIERNVRWPEKDEFPPLSASRAINLARVVFEQHVSMADFPKWRLRSTEVLLVPMLPNEYSVDQDGNPIDSNSTTEKWYWLVRFVAAPVAGETKEGYEPVFEIPVLMTGDTVPVSRDEERTSVFEVDPEVDAATDGQHTSWRIESSFNYVAVIEGADAKKAPKWTGGNENPPLPPRKAMTAADQAIKKCEFLKDDTNFYLILTELRLQEFQPESWVWIAHYQVNVKEGGSTGPEAYLEMPVLMNGATIMPIEEAAESAK